jgi:3-deoxy-7-phosphoheptulonate synthase
MNSKWNKSSWTSFKAIQQPDYPNLDIYRSVLEKINSYPPLVFIGEVKKLRKQIALAGDGESFILQGGDCAERFIDCNEIAIKNKIKILLQMSIILTYGARKPVLKIGRIAGRYSKPRSNSMEIVDNNTIPVYRGDSVNIFSPDSKTRVPDPERLLMAFFHSQTTLNFIRSLIAGGFTDMHHPYQWNLFSIENSPEWKKYEDTVEKILDAINFMESFGGANTGSLGKIDFFISHEGLILGYEEALTRKDSDTGEYYNLGAHMLWIGDRTRDIKGAHVEYFRGIGNPIGIKISPSMDKDELIDLLNILNPKNTPGKITLISRMGKDKVDDYLPALIKKVKKQKSVVTWSSDPMHGNTFTLKDNYKTRNFNDILEEIKKTYKIHKTLGSYMAGIHFELTGDDVTECTGGSSNLTDSDLNRNYETYCDPRLNYTQSLEMAFLISELLNSD